MQVRPLIFLFSLAAALWLASSISLVSEAAKREETNGAPKQKQPNTLSPRSMYQVSEEPLGQAEAEQKIIHLSEPYKTLMQTTTRFALVQSKIPYYMDVDFAMNMLADFGELLTRPSALVRAAKLVVFGGASVFMAMFLFPGAYVFAEAVWKDPSQVLRLDRYLVNGISEKSVLGMISSRTDDALSMVGLNDGQCREKSVCYIGEILKCNFPTASDAVARFASKRLPRGWHRENRYVKAFLTGFSDRNCTAITIDKSESQCIGNIISSLLDNTYKSA